MAAETRDASNPDQCADEGGAPILRIRLLGEFRVSVGGQPVPDTAWRQRRAAAVVKLLALEPTHRLHRERLMDLLWPDLDYDSQLNNLRQALHHARRQLEAAGMAPGKVLRRDGDTVVLAEPGQVWVDAHAVAQIAGQARQSLTPETAHAALALYEGDLLPDDLYDDWSEPHRTTLRAAYLVLLSQLAQFHVERNERGEAIHLYQRLVQAEPTQEAAHVALMRLYALGGQPELALAQYDQLVTILARDLDAEPEPSTRSLADEIASGRVVAVSRHPQPNATRSTIALPSPVSSLVGRAEEITDVRRLLASERLVTLTGPGGIGKTRLAIEAARGLADRFPDGIVFIDLTPLADPDLVVPAIAQALDVRESGGQPLLATLIAVLRERRLLLALDNFEHVISAGTSIATLLERASLLSVLVTSRVRLRLRGEREYPVPPLTVAGATEDVQRSTAVALFVERAQAVQPAFRLTGENAEAVAAICRRLDGLPLAIELAAARCRVLAPDAILDRLERPLTLLAGGAADLPQRQQTMRATIQWSYDLLTSDEQRIFARLSVFAGGWSLAAAESVAALPDGHPAVLDGLESLADKSLISQRVQQNDELRFDMLATIREFGLERLAASGDEPAIRDRHAGWAARFVEEAGQHVEGAEQVRWLARLEQDNENIRAALEWLRQRGHAEPALRMIPTLRLHWFSRGRISEGYEQISAVTALPESAAYPALLSDALLVTSFLARNAGDGQRAYDAARASLALSHQIHDRQRAADGLVNLGHIAFLRGQLDDARTLLQRSLANYRDLHNEQGIADSLGFLALTDVQSGDLATAAQRLEQCIAIWDGLADLQGVAWASTQLGLVLLEQTAYQAAWDNLMTSLTISETLDFRGDIYQVFDGLAWLAVIHGRAELAARLAAAATSVREESAIRLTPFDQASVDRLLESLHSSLGAGAVEDAWSRRRDWTLAELVRSVTETLAPLFATTTTATLSAVSEDDVEVPPVNQTEASR